MRRLWLLALLRLGATTQQSSAPAPDPGVPPIRLILATDNGAVTGTLVAADESGVKLRTSRGEQDFRFASLAPFSAWRLRSLLAGRDAAKHLELAEFCRDQQLWREARWEYAAARALDPNVKPPDLQEFLKNAAEEFLPGAAAMPPDQIQKKLDAQAATSRTSRAQEEQRKHQELKEKLGISEVTTLVWRGDVSKRLDIVIASDGYAAGDQAKFNTIADQLIKGILKVEPMANYPSYINFHRINIVEPTSGLRNGQTRLGCNVANGILTCNRAKAWEVAQAAPDADLVCVIANVQNVRATGGGGVLTLDASGDINDTAIHELGHAFAGLDDEYVDDSVAGSHPDWGPEQEPHHINTTREPDPKKVKWHYWNYPPPSKGVQVGCFEGAYYRAKGYYRPSPTCRMNSSSDPMCPVCFEQMEKSFYRLVSPIDDASPDRASTIAFLDDDLVFSANAVVTEGKAASLGSLSAAWYVDGARSERASARDKTTTLRVRGSDLKPGRHEVALRVEFQNKRIRRDHGLLSGHRVWDVDVLPFPRSKLTTTGDPVKGPVALKLEGPAAQAGVRAVLAAAPPGTALEASGAVVCATDEALSGVFRLRFDLVDREGRTLGSEERPFTVPNRNGRNVKPFLKLPSEIEAVEGRALYFRIEAWDPNGDLLAFSAAGLPEGAVLDSATGELFWDLGYSQGGRYDNLKITVTDGQMQSAGSTRIVVRDAPTPRPDRLEGFDLILGLRSSSSNLKGESMDRMEKMPVTFRLLEYLRLLRDRDPAIADTARSRLETLLGSAEGQTDPRLYAIFVGDIELHLWHFTDAPKILEFLDARLATAETMKDPNTKTRAARLRKILKTIAAYNKSRGF